MPITQSAKKALRQSLRRKAGNAVRRQAYRRAVTEYRKLIVARRLDEAKSRLPSLFQALDKAARARVVEKNKASRLKSRLAKLLNRRG